MPPLLRLKSGFILAVALAAAAATAIAAPAPLPAFSADYKVLRNGSPIGKATLSLTRGSDGAWTFTTTSHGSEGLAAALGLDTHETSVFHWVGNLPQCDSYEYKLSMLFKHRQRSVRCNWNNHTIVVKDDGTHTFATRPGVVERHTVPLALEAGLLAGQHEFDLPVAVRDRIEIQHYAAQGRATVKVPAGTFNATRVHRTDGDHHFEAWFAPRQLPAPVKVDQGGSGGFSLVLESWSPHS